MLTERASALFEALERQASEGVEEIAGLRERLNRLEAENASLREALSHLVTAESAPPRSAHERGYPLPRRSGSDERHGEPPVEADPAAAVVSEPAAPESSAEPAVSATAPADAEPPSPQALLDSWYRRYTRTFFKGHTRPLKVGIHEDLLALEPWPEKLVRRALACYVHLPRYLKAVRAGAERVDLEGQPAGVVDDEEARHARKKLEALQAKQRARDAGTSERESRKNVRLDRKLSDLLAKHGRH
ncbi:MULTISPECIES: ProQ/FINO family protein [unclassified Modicisalibacter]|uniref:ProQ/FINO family protein n=1 Tax=unclassified Modicisalibacter TaxID=2679913 RepID=UPI001CCBEFF5|nr:MULTISPECIES: ProQ/FINO family protein [unclassified Modicisalibacter]MBZ9557512.1 ABC transporter substrate-binding protein [Modicisalibacter sp. R2A 31.J]MBZ9573823.1 ABC transporter substrate-binding protein [Modicisalibacter sp. MOD 31.J]